MVTLPSPIGPRGIVPLVDLRAWDRVSDGCAPHSQKGYWAMIHASILTRHPHADCDHARGRCYEEDAST